MSKFKISTSQINKWLNHVVENNSHPRINGKEVKFKYGTQVSKNPLTIKIFQIFLKKYLIHIKDIWLIIFIISLK